MPRKKDCVICGYDGGGSLRVVREGGALRCELHLVDHIRYFASLTESERQRLINVFIDNIDNAAFFQLFANAKLPGPIVIDDKTLGDIRIGGIVIYGDVIFRNCRFIDNVELTDLVVGGEARIENCQFTGNVRIERAVFAGNFYLSDCSFLNDTHFSDSIYKNMATFYNNNFERYFSLRSARFFEYAWFIENNFHGYYSQIGARFEREVIYENCRFVRLNSFDRSYFLRSVNLKSCVFIHAPTFFDVTFCENVEIQDVIFADIKSYDAYNSYRTLRKLFSEHNMRRHESFFYWLEQASLTRLQKNPFEKIIALLYEFLSGYGTSISRVLLSTVIGNFVFTGIYWLISRNIKLAIYFHFQQIFSPFENWKTDIGEAGAGLNSFSNKIVSSFDSLFFIIMVGFFLLAIRWRFKSE